MNGETSQNSGANFTSGHSSASSSVHLALIGLYAIVAIVVIPIFPHFVSPNEFSRWATTISLLERGTGEISWSVPVIGTMEDTAEVGSSLYSNKPPGTSFAGIPGYALVRATGGDATEIRFSMTMMRLTASTIPVIGIGLLLLRAGRRMGAEVDQLSFALVALLFGTPLFTYGLLNFSHALTAFGLFVAIVFAFLAPLDDPRSNGAVIGAGLGLAGWSEYTAAVFIVLILGTLLLQKRGKELLYALLAGAPFLATLLWYQWAAFGNPLAISNAFERHSEFRQLSERGVFGIGAPSPMRIGRLLLDGTNGLLLFSPVLIASVASLPRMSRSLSRSTTWIVIGLPVAALILFSGYPNWHGGWSVGPRYLVPLIPLLTVPLLFARRGGILQYVLLGWSVTAVVLVSTTFPFVPNGMVIPWGTLGLHLLADGLAAPNLLHLVSHLLGRSLPLLVIGTLLIFLPHGRRRWAFAGIMACLAVGFIALQISSPLMRLQRSYIEAVYFEDDTAFEREFGSGFELPEPLKIRAIREQRLPPVSWPFREE